MEEKDEQVVEEATQDNVTKVSISNETKEDDNVIKVDLNNPPKKRRSSIRRNN